MFEFIFLLATAHTIIILPYVAYYKKEYILDIDDKDAGLAVALWFVMFILVDLLCLKTLPILTKLAIMSLFLCEFQFEITGQLGMQRK